MTIIPYTPTHQEAVLALFRLNTPQYFAREEEQDLKQYLEREREDYFLVEQEGQIIGAGGINYGFEEGKAARISWDFIHPAHQRKGIGKYLLEYRIQKIKERSAVGHFKDIQRLIVRTSQLVYPFYQKNGFETQSIEKDFWAEGLDLYLMEMPL